MKCRHICIESRNQLSVYFNTNLHTTFQTVFDILYVDTVFVSENYRRQGIGRRLIDAMEQRAKALGANMIRLDTFDWQGYEFYKNLGYEEVGHYYNEEDKFHEYFFVKRIES